MYVCMYVFVAGGTDDETVDWLQVTTSNHKLPKQTHYK